jgi:LPXTG-motif cell wall-anchored protein
LAATGSNTELVVTPSAPQPAVTVTVTPLAATGSNTELLVLLALLAMLIGGLVVLVSGRRTGEYQQDSA